MVYFRNPNFIVTELGRDQQCPKREINSLIKLIFKTIKKKKNIQCSALSQQTKKKCNKRTFGQSFLQQLHEKIVLTVFNSMACSGNYKDSLVIPVMIGITPKKLLFLFKYLA